jgi:hypothetical protein
MCLFIWVTDEKTLEEKKPNNKIFDYKANLTFSH